eukprot:1633927-Rhodomonas_salina.2
MSENHPSADRKAGYWMPALPPGVNRDGMEKRRKRMTRERIRGRGQFLASYLAVDCLYWLISRKPNFITVWVKLFCSFFNDAIANPCL